MIPRIFIRIAPLGGSKHLAGVAKKKAAFTLLETILSLTLISLLMVGVTTGIALYAQYQGRGVIGIRDAKILAGTVADLRGDLRACYPAERASLAADRALQGLSASRTSPVNESTLRLSLNEQVLLFDQAAGEEIIQFVGRPQAMLFRRHGGNQRFNEPGLESDSVINLVLWVAPALKDIRLPQSVSGQRVTDWMVRPPANQIGLRRATRTFPAFPAEGSLRRSREDLVVQSGWLCNERIKAASFRYFDSNQWLSDWDSHLRDGEIPAAVEITIVLAARPNRTDRVIVQLRDAG